jgi:hypothetical protein
VRFLYNCKFQIIKKIYFIDFFSAVISKCQYPSGMPAMRDRKQIKFYFFKQAGTSCVIMPAASYASYLSSRGVQIAEFNIGEKATCEATE